MSVIYDGSTLTPGCARYDKLTGDGGEYFIEWRCSHEKCSSSSKTLMIIISPNDSAEMVADLMTIFINEMRYHELNPDAPVPMLKR